MSTFVVNKNSKSNEGRTNTLQRRLTQQLLDQGVSRDTAIRHAAVTIFMSTESFDRHGKSIPQVFGNSFRHTLEDLKDGRRGPSIDVFNVQRNYQYGNFSQSSSASL